MFSEVPYISIDRVHIMVSTVQFSEKMIKSLKKSAQYQRLSIFGEYKIIRGLRGQENYAIVVSESKTKAEAD